MPVPTLPKLPLPLPISELSSEDEGADTTRPDAAEMMVREAALSGGGGAGCKEDEEDEEADADEGVPARDEGRADAGRLLALSAAGISGGAEGNESTKAAEFIAAGSNAGTRAEFASSAR